MAHLATKALRHSPEVEVGSDDGLVTVRVDAEDRLVFTLGDARVLMKALRGLDSATFVQRLEVACHSAHDHFRYGRRHSSMVA